MIGKQILLCGEVKSTVFTRNTFEREELVRSYLLLPVPASTAHRLKGSRFLFGNPKTFACFINIKFKLLNHVIISDFVAFLD